MLSSIASIIRPGQRVYELARGESVLVGLSAEPMLLKVLSLIGARIVPWLENVP